MSSNSLIGQKLGSFRIESELGSGAMGIVYLANHESKNRPAAIKIIAAEQMGKGKSFDRFLREATILEQFRHPNIVRYLARGRSGATYYYAMEYVSGPTLDKVIKERETLPWREVVAIGIQLCDALHYSHQHGVVHRDLKPSNLMMTEKGQLKLTDFGIAKDLDATALTATGRTLGTAAYMAPEQIRGTPDISHKTDLYSLGAVLYQLLTGEPPFPGTSAVVLMHAHMNSPPPRASARTEEIPKVLDDLLVTLMAKNPSDRPWDAAAVGQTLADLQAKSTRHEKIVMVWPEAGTAASMPSRASIVDDSAFTKPSASRKKGKKGRRWTAWREISGMVAAFVAVAGLFVYLSLPLSQKTLYQRAKVLMQSNQPLDWIRARDEYIDRLDERFPEHPYREETEAWRDQVSLRDAERRASNLEKANLAAFSKPNNEAEALFVHTFEEATAALKIHHDADAIALWRKMEDQLTPEGRPTRGWVLIAKGRADELAKTLARRRETVAELLAKATLPDQMANNEAAQKYRVETLRDLVKRFEAYPDVADLVAKAKGELPAEPPGK